MKGELSLAGPPPEGAGRREIAWADFLGAAEHLRGVGWGAGAVPALDGPG